jgi:hypothetical protein
MNKIKNNQKFYKLYSKIKFIKEFIKLKEQALSINPKIRDKHILKTMYNYYKKANIYTGFRANSLEKFYFEFQNFKRHFRPKLNPPKKSNK